MGCIWAYGSKILTYKYNVNVIAKGKSQENSTHLLLWEQINSFTIFSESYNHQKNIPETVEKVKWISSSRNFSINKEIDHKPLLDKRGTWMLENWIIQYLLSCILFTWRTHCSNTTFGTCFCAWLGHSTNGCKIIFL